MPRRISRGLSRKGRRSAGTLRTGSVGRRASRTVVMIPDQSSLRLLQFVDLALELADVPELAIDRGETHVRDVIELLQFLHQPRANLLGRHLTLRTFLELRLDAVGDGLELLDADGPLLGRGQEPGDELLPLKRFAI